PTAATPRHPSGREERYFPSGFASRFESKDQAIAKRQRINRFIGGNVRKSRRRCRPIKHSGNGPRRLIRFGVAGLAISTREVAPVMTAPEANRYECGHA